MIWDLNSVSLTTARAMVASDLGPNLVEVPVSRSEEPKDMESTQQHPTSSSKVPNMQPDNGEPQKSRWWRF